MPWTSLKNDPGQRKRRVQWPYFAIRFDKAVRRCYDVCMNRFDASTAECFVFTYAEGILSPFAHDLRIRVSVFAIDIQEDRTSVRATFDAQSLRTDCVMKEGKERFDILSEKDRKEIEGYIVKDILDAEFYDEIAFRSTTVLRKEDGYRVEGVITLCGTDREIEFPVRTEGGRLVAEMTIHQPDFGIKPFRAMMGAIRVRPDVLVRVAVPV